MTNTGGLIVNLDKLQKKSTYLVSAIYNLVLLSRMRRTTKLNIIGFFVLFKADEGFLSVLEVMKNQKIE